MLKLFYSGNFNIMNYSGHYIQLLPHAKNVSDKINVFDKHGNMKKIVRKPFYFKKDFITQLIF